MTECCSNSCSSAKVIVSGLSTSPLTESFHSAALIADGSTGDYEQRSVTPESAKSWHTPVAFQDLENAKSERSFPLCLWHLPRHRAEWRLLRERRNPQRPRPPRNHQ